MHSALAGNSGPHIETNEHAPAGDAANRKAADGQPRLLRAAHGALREAERIGHLKDQFLVTLSHELRTPLNAILGWATVLRRGPVDTGTMQEAVSVIERNARLQVGLIDDLLDMSAILTGKIRLDVQLVSPVDF